MTAKEARRATMKAEVGARRRRQAAPSLPPGAWARRAACTGRSPLFDDPERAAEALAVCATCPVLTECSQWALGNAVDGVAGGMTSAARTAFREARKMAEPVVAAEEFMPLEVVAVDCGRWLMRSDVILAAVARWTRDGESADKIAARLGVTRRSVERYKSVCRDRPIIT